MKGIKAKKIIKKNDRKESKIFFRHDYRKHNATFPLTENNRIMYVYKQSKTGKIIEVICVSLDIMVNNRWKTIVYYDNHHGPMHRHTVLSLQDGSDTVTQLGVRQKGTSRRLMRWAIKDLQSNYLIYKRKFLKMSGYSKQDIILNLV